MSNGLTSDFVVRFEFYRQSREAERNSDNIRIPCYISWLPEQGGAADNSVNSSSRAGSYSRQWANTGSNFIINHGNLDLANRTTEETGMTGHNELYSNGGVEIRSKDEAVKRSSDSCSVSTASAAIAVVSN